MKVIHKFVQDMQLHNFLGLPKMFFRFGMLVNLAQMIVTNQIMR